MTNIVLRRVTFTPDSPTFGMLLSQGLPLCLTLERPWQENQHGISCIPPGTYQCVPHDTPEKPNCWEVTGVSGREAILIHAGNTVVDTEGCLLVGLEIDGSSILKSQDALNHLRATLPKTFTLEILNP
jgi:Family of unknown function (DUF5675)